MIPNIVYGAYAVDDSVRRTLDNVVKGSNDLVYLRDREALRSFVSLPVYPQGKVLIANQESLFERTVLSDLKEALVSPSFHLILLHSGISHALDEEFSEGPQIHTVNSSCESVEVDLAHHLHSIKVVLESQWLRAKIRDVLSLYEEVYCSEVDHKCRIERFTSKVRLITDAKSVALYIVRNEPDEFVLDAGAEAATPAILSKVLIEKCLKWENTLSTHLLTEEDCQALKSADWLPQGAKGSLLATTFMTNTVPALVLYTFEEGYDQSLLWELCNICSRELSHLLRSKSLRKQHETLKALTEINNLNASKTDILWKVVFQLKRYFEAGGASIIELAEGQDGERKFEKTYLHHSRKEHDIFPADQGWASYCVINKKALLLNTIDRSRDPVYGSGYAFDPGLLSFNHAEAVNIPSVIAPRTVDHEKSVIYFPLLKDGAVIGALKIGNFARPSAFSLQHLHSLKVFADPIVSLITNAQEVAKLRQEIDDRQFQEQMIKKAEALFFYREIALGVFHQAVNHLNTLAARMLMLEVLAEKKEDNRVALRDCIDEIMKHTNTAKKLISKAQKRGQHLEPLTERCNLIRGIIKPAYDYAKEKAEHYSPPIEVIHSFTNREYYVLADEDLAKESFINVLNNALRAVKENKSNAKKEIFIAVREIPDGKRVRVEITDTGIGIPPEVYPKLFTPFFTTHSNSGGTGLGLFFARKLIEHFDGTISVQRSAPGKGTTVVITFPLLEE